MLSVAMLVIVMSVMNGFRAELIDKIVGLNGHAIIQAYGGRLENWEQVLEEVRATDEVVRATPLIEQPLLATFNGRVEAVILRGNTPEDIGRLSPNVLMGDISTLQPGADNVAIGSRLAMNLGARVGDVITVINPQGRSTPFGTVPRQVGYTIAAIFEVGVYDYDETFIVMPIPDAQTLLLTGDSIGMIEVTTTDPDRVGEILAPLARQLQGQAVVTDWKTINPSLFEALQVERVAMFFALSMIVLVAAFNILSSLVMLVRSKTRDIAILRTMGATRQEPAQDLRHHRLGDRRARDAGRAAARLPVPAIPPADRARRSSCSPGRTCGTRRSASSPSCRPQTDPFEVLMICAMAMGLSFLATLYPAYRAASTDPVQVLRYE